MHNPLKRDPFSDPAFVQRFDQRRCENDSVNSCIDEPTIAARVEAMGPNMVLEVGCATGRLTEAILPFVQQVVALDRSAEMIATATSRLPSQKVEFCCEDVMIFESRVKFDLVLSAMTLHLIRDLSGFASRCHGLIRRGGSLLLSQRHPLRTANPEGAAETSSQPHWVVSGYFRTGERQYQWLGQDVTYYHRTMSDLVMTFLEAGFTLCDLSEPQPLSDDHTERIVENTASPAVVMFEFRKD